jgi:hypothetical protein
MVSGNRVKFFLLDPTHDRGPRIRQVTIEGADFSSNLTSFELTPAIDLRVAGCNRRPHPTLVYLWARVGSRYPKPDASYFPGRKQRSVRRRL